MALTFAVDRTSATGVTALTVEPEVAVVVGFTGRDRAAVDEHLAELEALGVPVPDDVPAHYWLPSSALVQTDRLDVSGADTSGEVECVVVVHGDETYITVGSDHTDRAAEAMDVPLSKLACQKVLATTAWPIADVADHVDELRLSSSVTIGGTDHDYQDGQLSALMPIVDIVAGIPFADQERPDTYVVFTGTLPAIGGIRPADRFRASLTDPVRARSLALEYHVIDIRQLAETRRRGDPQE